jgi:hypothetical protein
MCPSALSGPGEADLRAMAVVLRDDIAVERAADEIDHVLPAAAASLGSPRRDSRSLTSSVNTLAQIGLVAGVDRTEIAVLELFDLLDDQRVAGS